MRLTTFISVIAAGTLITAGITAAPTASHAASVNEGASSVSQSVETQAYMAMQEKISTATAPKINDHILNTQEGVAYLPTSDDQDFTIIKNGDVASFTLSSHANAIETTDSQITLTNEDGADIVHAQSDGLLVESQTLDGTKTITATMPNQRWEKQDDASVALLEGEKELLRVTNIKADGLAGTAPVSVSTNGNVLKLQSLSVAANTINFRVDWASGARCVVDLILLAPWLAPAKYAKVIKKIAALAKSSPRIAKAVKALGGLQKSAKVVLEHSINTLKSKLGKVGKKLPSFPLSAAERAGAVTIGAFIFDQIWELLGLGSCVTFVKSI